MKKKKMTKNTHIFLNKFKKPKNQNKMKYCMCKKRVWKKECNKKGNIHKTHDDSLPM